MILAAQMSQPCCQYSLSGISEQNVLLPDSWFVKGERFLCKFTITDFFIRKVSLVLDQIFCQHLPPVWG